MDDKLIDNLVKQKEAVENKIQRLTKRLAELREMDAQMEAAFKILIAHDPRFAEKLSINSTPKTVGAMAIALLKEHPNGLTANDILEKIQQRWMPNLVRTSLSPPLSRLKHHGEILYKNGLWYLPPSDKAQGSLFSSKKSTTNQSVNEDSENESD